MATAEPQTDTLTLEGLGGLYNGEVYVLLPGQSATAGKSSLASFPVTLSRNYRRLARETPIESLMERIEPEHVRFLYLGDGRLIVESLAGEDVRVGRRPVPDRMEVDLTKGRVEVAFGYGERFVASSESSADEVQEFAPKTDGEEELQGVFMALLGGGVPKQEKLELLPPVEAERETDPERDTGPIPQIEPPPERPEPRRAKRGLWRLLGKTRPPVLLSILFHLVLVLALFSYFHVVGGSSEKPPAEVKVVTAETSFLEKEPEVDDSPTPVEADLPEAPLPSPLQEAEQMSPSSALEDSSEMSGAGPDTAGVSGLMGIGPGDVGAAPEPGGASGLGRPGGGTRSRAHVMRGLDWLAEHQLPDGSWGAVSSLNTCRQCGGHGTRDYRVAMTGLALLAFTGAGHTHRAGAFREAIRRAVRFLRERQNDDGSFHRRADAKVERPMYGQAMATLALAELYRTTHSPYLRGALLKAVRYIERQQQPYAGWRYGPGDRDSDTSVTGWQALALVAAERADVTVNPAVAAGVRAWIDEMTEPRSGRVGYNRRGRGSLGVQAAAMNCLLLYGERSSHPVIKAGKRLLLDNPPHYDPNERSAGNPPDILYWYLGTLAAKNVSQETFRKWRKELTGVLVSLQVTQGHARGSWAPPGRWGSVGGRVMVTALAVLALEVAESYPNAFR